MHDPFEDITAELGHVSGGASHHAKSSGWSLFGWLDDMYKHIVYSVGSKIGGSKLAEKLYGHRTTDADRSRAQAAMHKFLVAGHKLPKGVPNIFGA